MTFTPVQLGVGVLGLCALSMCLAAAPAAAQHTAPRLAPGQPIPPAELEAFVDGVVTTAMAEDRIVGVTVAAVQGGEIVLEKGYGFADLDARRRVDPAETLFRIGSITKTFTWIEIMRLVEAGRLSLDDPVNDHLPPEVRMPDEGFDQPIRVRDLMTHQPGLEDRVFGVLFVRDPERIRPLSEFLRETRPKRVQPPGEQSSYSNYGVALAGAIVEHATGRAWQDAVEEDILVPLGMTRTTGREPHPPRGDLPAPMPQTLAAKVSRGYRVAGVSTMAQPFEHLTHIAPAGSMSSTAHDMARYMLMLLGDGMLDGARIFGAEAARAFRTPMTQLAPEVGSWNGGFAEAPAPGGFRMYGHNGATLTFFSNMLLFPELDFGLFVSTNTASGVALSSALPTRVVQHFYAAPVTPLAGRPDLRAEMAPYAGQYRPSRRRHGALEGFVMRLQAQPIVVSPDGYLTLVAPNAPQRFVPTGEPDRFRHADGPGELVFERRDGRLVLPTLGLAAERLGPLESPGTLIVAMALAALAAVAVLVGAVARVGRTLPRTQAQARAGRLQSATSLLWIASFASAGLLAARVPSDPSPLLYDWPPTSLLAFSTLALLASLATAGLLALLPAVWAGAGGWSRWRKTRFSIATLLFAACALLLLAFGALKPWNP